MDEFLGGSVGGVMQSQPYGLEKMARMPTMRERIDLAVKQAEDRLAAAKEAQEIFSRNPDLEKLINVLQRGGF